MSVLLTRPERDSREIAAELAAHGVASVIWPLTRIERVAGQVDLPDEAEGLLFTSGNGLRAFAEACARRDLPALCVGARTAALAREAGFVDVRSAEGHAPSLARLAARAGLARLFHPRGRDAAADLPALLAPGVAVTEQVLYAARPTGAPPPRAAAALAAGEVGTVALWSARNARLLAEQWVEAPLPSPATMAAVAISRQAARPLDKLGFRTISVAEHPDRPSMIRAILDAALRR